MNPSANPYPQQPPQGWPQANLSQQMGNMNLSGPPKQPPSMPPMSMAQQFPPHSQPHPASMLNNNQQMPPPPMSGSGAPMQQSFVSPTNNNQFPPTNGLASSPLGPPPMMQAGKPSMPPQQQGFPPMAQPAQPSQRPPVVPGQTSSNAPQNGLSNGSNGQHDLPPPPTSQQPSQQYQGMPPQPITQQPAPPPSMMMPPSSTPQPTGAMNGAPGQPPMSSQFPGMPQQQQQPPQRAAGMPPMPSAGPQSPPGGMQPMSMNTQNPSGMPPMPQQQQQQQFARMNQGPTGPAQQHPGMPPMPMPGQINPSGMPSMPPMGLQSAPGMAPMSNLPPMGYQTNPGMPPMSHQPQMGGMMPPMPGQQPSQPPYQGMQQQNRQNFNQNTPNYAQQPGVGQQFQQYPQSPMQQQQQQASRRLDPDQMPNPIQVMNENQKSAGGIFSTATIGQVPPLVTTKFLTQDQGNSGPRYVRSTMYNIPATTEMMKQSAVPFALVVSPYARTVEDEMQPPIVDFGELGPIRCVRCKAYMSPYMQFIDAGRRFQCLLCKATTEVPQAYFQHLDHTGQRADKYERPELVLGTYEFLATKDYCRNNTIPNPPAMIFVIDVSYNNVKSGLVHLLCSQIKNIIRNLPIDQGQTRSKMRVGFITYNKTVHFYNIKSTLAQPQMMVVGDVHEMFMPLLDGFLADPEECETVIDLLMEQIPKMFGDTRETETILLPAIQAGLEALKASECAGKLLVFHSTLPVSEAPGQLKNRDDRKLLGTEKEKQVLTPQNTAYNNVGQDCVNAGCSVDLFIFNNSYIDLATIGQVSRLTGGEIYKYTYFQADIDGQRLIHDLTKHVARPVAFDAVMRVRTSTGTRPTDFYGHFFMSNTTDMEIAAIDCDKSIAIEIKHDDKLPPEDNVYVQIALLYTSTGGQRRLRVLNLAFRTCVQLADLFRSCDLDTTILFFAKQGVTKLLEHTPKVFKDNLVNRAAQILACYRKNCASPTSAGQLILPECLKLLPLYVSCLLKNDAFAGGSDMTVDDRSYAMYFVSTMDLKTSVEYFYPRLIPIHTVEPEGDDIPAAIRCTADKITDDGAYILENGVYLFVYLGFGLSAEFTQQVFGVQNTHQIDTERIGLPLFDNPLSKRVHGIIDRIQREKTRCMRVALIRQRDKLESVFRHFLIEDRGSNGIDSYVDFLCYMHKEIRQLLS